MTTYRILALALCLSLGYTARSQDMDIIMAQGNAQVTLAVNPIPLQKVQMRDAMEIEEYGYSYTGKFSYHVGMSMPLSLTAEYAIKDGTTVGVNVNHYTYNLSQRHQSLYEDVSASVKGSHTDLHVRVLRYWFQRTNGAFYILGEAGIRSRAIQYTESGNNDNAYITINHFPETRREGYKRFSWDIGMGMKFKVLRQVGISMEFSKLNPMGRYGLFYLILPAGRRSKDKIGW